MFDCVNYAWFSKILGQAQDLGGTDQLVRVNKALCFEFRLSFYSCYNTWMVRLDRLSRKQHQIRRRELLILVGVFFWDWPCPDLALRAVRAAGKKEIGCLWGHGIIGGVCLPPPHWPFLLDRFAYFLCWEDLLYRFGEKQVMLSSLPMVVLWKRTLLWFSTFGVLWCPMYCQLEVRRKNSTKVLHSVLCIDTLESGRKKTQRNISRRCVFMCERHTKVLAIKRWIRHSNFQYIFYFAARYGQVLILSTLPLISKRRESPKVLLRKCTFAPFGESKLRAQQLLKESFFLWGKPFFAAKTFEKQVSGFPSVGRGNQGKMRSVACLVRGGRISDIRRWSKTEP